MQFRIEVSSDLDYENTVVDIVSSTTQFAKLTLENEVENVNIIIYDSKTMNISWIFKYHELKDILEMAHKKIYELNNSH